MKNKKVITTSALLALAMLSVGLPASANGCDMYARCDNNGSIYASAYANGFAGTGMDGRWSETHTNSAALALSSTDTRPASAGAVAALEQETWGTAADRDFVEGELYMEGETGAYAQVGRHGEEASTSTKGTGSMYGIANGHESGVAGGLAGESSQGSIAVDTKWGGDSDAEAEQSVAGVVTGHANDRHLATVEVGVSVSSHAEAND